MTRLPWNVVIALVVLVIAGLVGLSSKFDYLVWTRGGMKAPRRLKESEVRITDLPRLVEAISNGSASVRWAALMLDTTGRASDADAAALQISVEKEKLGFDWVLLSPRNIADQEIFRRFARAQGFEPSERSGNGVSYIRVESADVAQFTARVVTSMYNRPQEEPLGLVYEGFDWAQR